MPIFIWYFDIFWFLVCCAVQCPPCNKAVALNHPWVPPTEKGGAAQKKGHQDASGSHGPQNAWTVKPEDVNKRCVNMLQVKLGSNCTELYRVRFYTNHTPSEWGFILCIIEKTIPLEVWPLAWGGIGSVKAELVQQVLGKLRKHQTTSLLVTLKMWQRYKLEQKTQDITKVEPSKNDRDFACFCWKKRLISDHKLLCHQLLGQLLHQSTSGQPQIQQFGGGVLLHSHQDTAFLSATHHFPDGHGHPLTTGSLSAKLVAPVLQCHKTPGWTTYRTKIPPQKNDAWAKARWSFFVGSHNNQKKTAPRTQLSSLILTWSDR